MSYVSEQLEKLKAKNANEPEFIQAATEVLTSLEPVFEQNPKYEENGILEELQSLKELLCLEYLGLMTTARFRLTVASVFSSTVLSDLTRVV